jgi:hypothetical protein
MFELTYTLRDHGWANAEFSNGEAAYSVRASYLGDALGDLAKAARGLMRGLPEVTFSFIEEPGQHRFVVRRSGDDVLIEAFRLPGMFATSVERGESIFLATCSLRLFVDTIITCLRSVLNECGEDEYLRRWKAHPFPRRELEELVSLGREQFAGRPGG